MSKSGKTERILVVVDGDNMSDFLCQSSHTLHQMIDACVRDFVNSKCKMVAGPALFFTLHDGTSDMKFRAGRLAHKLMSEIAIPMCYEYRAGKNKLGDPAERGYDDREITKYVMGLLDKFDTLFVFASDYHFTVLIDVVVNDVGKTAYICGNSVDAGDMLLGKDYFIDLETLDLPEEPTVEEEKPVVKQLRVTTVSGGNISVHLRKGYWEDHPIYAKK